MELSRRRFYQMLAMLGLSPAFSAFGSKEGSGSGADLSSGPGNVSDPEILRLSRNGWMPNNEHLPVLLYRGAIDVRGDDPAARFEQVFTQNGWPPQWRNGVYTFHHYHSTAHEVLGFAGGSAQIMLGGENGHLVTANAGDVALLPTGTGHCKVSSSEDFLVVGAYPPGQDWDICRQAPSPSDQQRMDHLPHPSSDPVSGSGGPVSRLWTA